MLICDTSALVAYFDAGSERHVSVVHVVEDERGPLVVSPYVVAELDYLVQTRQGVDAEVTVLTELTSGAWELADFAVPDLRTAQRIIEQYRDQEVGLTDASLVTLAERYDTDRILTLDHRHFDVLRTIAGHRFTVLPG